MDEGEQSGFGWKSMLALALVFGVIGLYAIPQLLGGIGGTEPAVLMAQGVGAGAAILMGASALRTAFRPAGDDEETVDGLASVTELHLSEAPPTTHSAPTVFDTVEAGDSRGLDTLMIDEDIPAFARPVEAKAEWTLPLLQSLEWKRFEQLCAGYYREKGIRHVAMSLAANGGMDIYLFQDEDHPKRPTAVVHARTRGALATGVQGVRELLGVMAHERIERAFFMTNGVFTPEAKALGHHHKVVLVDAHVLLAMIQRLDADKQHRLLTEATAGDYRTPTCPLCGRKMVHATGTHGDYWGCSAYPKCTWTMPMVTPV